MISNTSLRCVSILRVFKVPRVHGILRDWINREIISEDPYDNEPTAEQALYEQLRQQEFEPIRLLFQSSSMLALGNHTSRRRG